jgi:hypothetical protein
MKFYIKYNEQIMKCKTILRNVFLKRKRNKLIIHLLRNFLYILKQIDLLSEPQCDQLFEPIQKCIKSHIGSHERCVKKTIPLIHTVTNDSWICYTLKQPVLSVLHSFISWEKKNSKEYQFITKATHCDNLSIF